MTEDFFILGEEPIMDKTDPMKVVGYKKYKECEVLFEPEKRVCPLNVTTKTIYTDKVFTVDFKRPAGGTLDLSGDNKGVDFDAEQYFKSIAVTYEEETLAQINTALGTLKPTLNQSSSVRLASNNSDIKTATREVARARFDISEPCWEEQLQAFVDQHVTDCFLGCNYEQ
ncbi:hypothetical protein [Symmachiella dynata]|uniref:hypothetical protein n=1 Tax=Symmachiella dynata TaxID=2527995 RepID=UPI0011A91E23|nr:hypothetical protein [Symmachiella dynata]